MMTDQEYDINAALFLCWLKGFLSAVGADPSNKDLIYMKTIKERFEEMLPE